MRKAMAVLVDSLKTCMGELNHAERNEMLMYTLYIILLTI